MKFEQFADSLVEESLREAADTFFGSRIRLDQELEFLQQKIEELQGQIKQIENWSGSLSWLLGGEKKFWQLMFCLQRDKVLLPDFTTSWRVNTSLASGMTLFRRYSNTVLNVYHGLHNCINDYLHGKIIDDKESGRKIHAVHYYYIQKWIQNLNKVINKQNDIQNASISLQFAKKMNDNIIKKENILGGGVEYDLDKEFKYNLVENKLPCFSELSKPSLVQGKIRNFCRRVYENDKNEIEKILLVFHK